MFSIQGKDDRVRAARKLTGCRGADDAFLSHQSIPYGRASLGLYPPSRNDGCGRSRVAAGSGLHSDDALSDRDDHQGLGLWLARPHLDMPRLVKHSRNGRLKLDEMITRTYALEEVDKVMTAPD